MRHYCSSWLGVLFTVAIAASPALGAPRCHYEGKNRTLRVTTEAGRRFQYVFGLGGAVRAMFDLDLAPDTNLIGDSFQGETTDRVIQWTYWNSRYRGAPHNEGDGDRRANVTMEGCFHGKFVCDSLAAPPSGSAATLVFRSRITHWFYSGLDRHGRPDFETTTRYELLDDGSLKVTRSILRRPWRLQNIFERASIGDPWPETPTPETLLRAEHQRKGALTSYLEGWTPLRRSALPHVRTARGVLEKSGYPCWTPEELGGWAMAYGEKQAVAVVLGPVHADKNSPFKTSVVFNRLDLPNHNLQILLPGVETDWPDDATLTQTLILVVGAPDEVARRAMRLTPTVPLPTIQVK